MFFGNFRKLADQAIADVTALPPGAQTTQAQLDKMLDTRDDARGKLYAAQGKAERTGGKGLLVWCVTGIANMFIALPIISLPLLVVTMAAVAVTGYQYAKAYTAKKNIERLTEATTPVIREADNTIAGRELAKRNAEADARAVVYQAKMAAEAAEWEAKRASFNTAATTAAAPAATDTDVDLDKDITVRRIKLKPQTSATV